MGALLHEWRIIQFYWATIIHEICGVLDQGDVDFSIANNFFINSPVGPIVKYANVYVGTK